MNYKDLEERIKLIQEELRNKVFSLNSGGCIHFAYYLSSALEILNIPHKVYFCDYYPLSTTYADFNSCHHVLVYIPEIGYVDGHKTKNSLKEYSYKRNLRLNINRLRTEYDWNELYNKEKYNSVVSETIKKYLSDY